MQGLKGHKMTALIDHLHIAKKSKMNFTSKPIKFSYMLQKYVKVAPAF